MGNTCKVDNIGKEYNNSQPGRQYKPNELELLNAQLRKIEIAKEYNIRLDEDINYDLFLKDNFTQKYGLYIDIKRFAIPIIGVINSGKSTFMNKILNLKDILQINNVVTTRFITIIRHDKNAEIPEVYQVKIERRNKGLANDRFNFIEKGENLLKSKGNNNIKNIIKELNEDIEKNNKQNSQKYLKDIEKYFLIVKTKIPLFEGEYEEYGNLIDFLDIPGLDESKESKYSEESVFEDFIPMIFSNILFPIFIFDIKSLATDNPITVIKNFFNLYIEKTQILNSKNNHIEYTKGIYFLNKMDLKNEDNPDIIFKEFFDKFKEIELGNEKVIKIKFQKDDNFFGIIATQLFKQKFDSFIEDKLEEIIIESKNSKKNSFKSFIKEFLLKKYDIDLNKAKEEKEDLLLKDRLNTLNDNLKKRCNVFNNPKFDLKEFTYLSKIKNNKLNKVGEDVNNDKDILLKIKQKIKQELDIFLNFNFEDFIQYIDNDKDLEEKKKFAQKRLYDKDFILNFHTKILSLFPNDKTKQFKNIKEIENQINNFSNYYNNKKIRIIFIGIISSGKTSLLNSIIGNNYNILQTTHKECTKSIYRIKYSKNISFCESELKIDKEYGNYFEDKDGTQIYDIDEIKKKIKNLNDEKSFKYYTLYVPIEGLESNESKENIELIDLPGLTEENEFAFSLKQLFSLSDGFIFTFNSLSIDDKNSNFIFDKITRLIRDRIDGFNFKNCLFHLNYIDEIEDDLIPDKIKEFKEIKIKKINEKIYIGNFIEKMAINDNILASDNINVSYISNTYYAQYQENVKEFQSLEFITNNKLKDIYENYIYDDFDENNQIEEFISKDNFENDNDFKEKLKKKMELIRQKSNDNDEDYLLKIAKFLVVFEKYKKKLIKKYEFSKAELFFQQFNNQMKLSEDNYKIILNQKAAYHIMVLLFNLFYYNELCLDEKKFDLYKNKIKLSKKIIEDEYQSIVKIIWNKLNEANKKIKLHEQKVIKIVEKREHLTVKEIKELIKDLEIEDKLNKIFNFLYDDLKKINLNFIYFCINEISSILDSKSFKDILSKISLSFKDVDNSSLNKATLYFAGGTIFSSLLASSSLPFLSAFGIIGVSLGVIVLVKLCSLLFINWLNDTNTQKVKDYFKKVTDELNKNIESFINSIKERKDEFIEKLEIKNKISTNEIIALKNSNYPYHFQDLLKLF